MPASSVSTTDSSQRAQRSSSRSRSAATSTEVEASLGAAFQHDRDLFEFAFQNKVLVSSPIVLFALLKSIAFGWQQQQVAENAAQIAEQGKTLHERIATFVEHLGGVGKALEGGADALFTKPIDFVSLRGEIDSRVERGA